MMFNVKFLIIIIMVPKCRYSRKMIVDLLRLHTDNDKKLSLNRNH